LHGIGSVARPPHLFARTQDEEQDEKQRYLEDRNVGFIRKWQTHKARHGVGQQEDGGQQKDGGQVPGLWLDPLVIEDPHQQPPRTRKSLSPVNEDQSRY
jgi:hypothetical protein